VVQFGLAEQDDAQQLLEAVLQLQKPLQVLDGGDGQGVGLLDDQAVKE